MNGREVKKPDRRNDTDRRAQRRRRDDARQRKLLAQKQEQEHRDFARQLMSWRTFALLHELITNNDMPLWQAIAIELEIDARIPQRA